LAATRAGELEALTETLNDVALPAPDATSFESSVEYDRRREIKESLIEETIAAALSFRQAARALGPTRGKPAGGALPWEPAAAGLDQAIRTGDADSVRKKLRELLRTFADEPLLYVPVGAGGHPLQVLRARAAQATLHGLLEKMPRLGLLKETFFLTQLARKMEQNAPPEGRRVTEFDRLFPVGLRISIETLLDAIESEAPEPDAVHIQELLNALTSPYLKLWLKHSQSLRLSVLETVQGSAEWLQIEAFVTRYGQELFTAQVLNLANLRAILHRGVEDWIDQLERQDETAERFRADLGGRDLPRDRAARFLEIVLQAVAENYDEYRDYNTTTTQSDYGNNLFLLLDFLRLKSAYDRDNWRLRPLLLTHEIRPIRTAFARTRTPGDQARAEVAHHPRTAGGTLRRVTGARSASGAAWAIVGSGPQSHRRCPAAIEGLCRIPETVHSESGRRRLGNAGLDSQARTRDGTDQGERSGADVGADAAAVVAGPASAIHRRLGRTQRTAISRFEGKHAQRFYWVIDLDAALCWRCAT
jgi:hypothetical protein